MCLTAISGRGPSRSPVAAFRGDEGAIESGDEMGRRLSVSSHCLISSVAGHDPRASSSLRLSHSLYSHPSPLLYVLSSLRCLSLMGQTTSRGRPSPNSHSIPSLSSPTVPTSSACEESDTLHESPPSSSRARGHSSIRRTLRSLLPHSRPTLDDSTSTDRTSSIRKRWRSSRRFSKRPSSLPNPPEISLDSRPHTSPAASVFDSDTPDPVAGGHPHRAEQTNGTHVQSSPCLPSVLLLLSGTEILHCQSALEEAHLGRAPLDSTDHDVQSEVSLQHTSSPPSRVAPPSTARIENNNAIPLDDWEGREEKTFVEGSSRDCLPPPPLSTASTPHSSAQDPVPEPTSETQAQPARHFQGPGPLVVVQGVVNTSDNATVAQSSSTSRPTRTSSNSHHPSATSISRRRSLPTPSNGVLAEERQNARSRLSAFIPRPSSMLGRRASTPDPTAVPSHERPSSDHPEAPGDPSIVPLFTQRNASATSSETEAHPDEEIDPRPRPLSRGSIDVLGTLLRFVPSAKYPVVTVVKLKQCGSCSHCCIFVLPESRLPS